MDVSFRLAAVALIGLAAASPAFAQQSADVSIEADPAQATEWTVDERVWGKFFEPNGRDAYPGLYAQHLSNSSLEEWFHYGNQPWQTRTSVLFRGVEEQDGLAYPWEPTTASGIVRFNQPDDDPVHGGSHQRVAFVTSSSRGGVKQRTALPHRRTLTYDVAFSARAESLDSVVVELKPTGKEPIRESKKAVPLTSSWQRDTLSFTLPRASGDCYVADGGTCSPSGKYTLRFTASADGARANLDLDWMTLIPDDAVRGKYNPTTISLLKRFNVLSLRWGGNWMSAYQWQDGIGPVRERPVRHNLAWGGLEHNYLGTAEFLELCELVGAEPQLNAPFNMDGEYPDVTPEEAANWVEYVNGSTDTEMGRLRAQHGHPEPWNVTNWQVGNESYGGYQPGHPDGGPEAYGRGMKQYAEAMKAVDSDINLIAAGADPLYRDYNGQAWNRALLRYAGDVIDGIDIHRYVNGVARDDKRDRWTRNEYLTALVAFPTMFEDIMGRLRDAAEEFGYPNMTIDVGEWNLGPANAGQEGWPIPNYPTMANAAFDAGMYNAFIRQGEVVRYAHQRDNTLYYRPFPVDFKAVPPGNYTFQFYAEPFDDPAENQWNRLPLDVSGPSFSISTGPEDANRFPVRWIGWENNPNRTSDPFTGPYVDASAIVTEGRDSAYVFLVNRDLQSSRSVRVQLAGEWEAEGETVGTIRQRSTGGGPFARQFAWGESPPFLNPQAFEVTEQSVSVAEDNGVRMTMQPAAVARLAYDLNKGTDTDEAASHPAKWGLRAPYPSPVRAGRAATVEYGVAVAGAQVQLALFDARGRRVRTVESIAHGSGWHRTRISTRGLASGTYFVHMKAGPVTKTTPLIVVR